MRRTKLRLLRRDALIKTGPVDHGDWIYRPVVGCIIRERFRLVRSLLAGTHCRRLLEVGYGSGVFMPELSQYCDELYGIDVHENAAGVASALAKAGVTAHLHCGSIESTPFEAGYFDAVVAVSAIEFVRDLPAACREIQRILAPVGRFIAITPGYSPLVDFGLRMLTGESATKDYDGRRQAVLPTLESHFEEAARLCVPRFAPRALRLYTGLCVRQPAASAPSSHIAAVRSSEAARESRRVRVGE
jgi:SAM-dependent methyltransferase